MSVTQHELAAKAIQNITNGLPKPAAAKDEPRNRREKRAALKHHKKPLRGNAHTKTSSHTHWIHSI